MGLMNRGEVKLIVASAARQIADYDGDIEQCTYPKFGQYHGQVFISALALSVAKAGQDIGLSHTKLHEFGNFAELINYIHHEQGGMRPVQPKIRLRASSLLVRLREMIARAWLKKVAK